MSTFTTEYCKYGDINHFIAEHHNKKKRYIEYRKKWENNKNDLLFLLLETVSTCNLKCPMCIHSIGYDHTQPMEDDVFDIIEQSIREMNIPSVGMNQINEPFLDKKIFERTKRIASIDCVLDIHFNTNGLLLNRQNSLKILEIGAITRLLIGFDAFSKEAYEKMRYGSDYDKVMNNIMNFLELKEKMNKKFPVVRISFVRTSINEHEVDKWFEFWKDKVDYISVQEYLTQVLNESKTYLIAKSSKRKEIEASRITCRQPFERAIIRGNGDVVPCCSYFATKMPIGNIKQNNLKDIWHGTKAKNLRKYFEEGRWSGHPICSKCLEISYGLTPRGTCA